MKTLIATLVLALSMTVAAASPLGDFYKAQAQYAACGGTSSHFSGGGGNNCGAEPVYTACPTQYFGDGSSRDCVDSGVPSGDAVFEADSLDMHLRDVDVDGRNVRYVKLHWNGSSFDLVDAVQ